ncbi:MAG: TetR/AcrR family transcriptional regulator [Spirochaetes bacterium]|jgi:AcrR family transcriptional regulator|nr:TetR/AcrR family transcriptional regulator [Spirochaetota bacterium]
MPPKGERRKLQIIETAKEMFIQNGFQSTHIGQVCEKLNIARGTVYQYFSNKKEILYAILDSVIDDIEDIFDQDDMKEYFKSSPDPKAMVKFINNRISKCISVLVNEPIVIRLIFRDISGIDTEVVDRVNLSVMSIVKIIAKEVAEIKNLGVFKNNVDPDITASMIVGGVMMIVYEYDKKNLNVLDGSVVDSIANNYLNGVLKQSN